MRGRLDVLRVPRFRLLFAARTTSLVGDAVAPIALSFAVLDLTRSATAVGVVLAALVTPRAVFVLVGGVVGDRFPRDRVLVATDLAQGAAQAVAATLLVTHHASVAALAVLAAVRGGASAFFLPASTGIVPETVPPERLQEANALVQGSRSVTAIVGAAVGGGLVAGIGAGPTIAVDAASFLVSALLVARLRLDRRPLRSSGVGRDLVDGWREFSARTWVWATVSFYAFYTVTGNAIFLTVGPLVTRERLGGAAAWGAILAGQAVGAVAGAVVALRVRPARPLRLCFLSLPLLAPVYVALALHAPVAAVAAAAVLAGVVVALFTVLWETALQEHVPADAISRVSAYDWLGSLTLAPVGLVLAPLAARAVGFSTALLLTAAAMCACALVGVLVRDVRELGRPRAEHDAAPALA